MRRLRTVTLLELVEVVQDTANSEEEVVAALTHLLRRARRSHPLSAAA